MSATRAEQIIESLRGRADVAPDPFVQRQWPLWMRLRPRVMTTRRDALLDALAAVPRAAPAPASEAWPHWLALLCWQMGPAPAADQRGIRLIAATFTAVLHLLFVLLLVWVALVRSTPPVQEQRAEQRTALRFVAAGQGHVQGEDNDAPAVDRPDTAAPAPAPAPDSASASSRAAAAVPAIVQAVASVPAPSVPAMAFEQVAPQPTPVEVNIAERDVPQPALPAPASVEVQVSSVPPAVQQPLPALRQIPPRAVDVVLQGPALPAVVERSVPMAETVPQPGRITPSVGSVNPVPATLDVPERSISLAQRAPSPAPIQRPVLAAAPLPAAPALMVQEREIASVQPVPAVGGVAPLVPSLPSALAGEVALVEREIATAAAVPAVDGPAPVVIASVPAAMPQVEVAPVLEREIMPAVNAPTLSGIDTARQPAQAVPTLRPAAVPLREREIASPVSGAALAAAAPDAAVAPAAQPVSTPGRPAAGTAQDWSRSAAGSDDWSRAGSATAQSSSDLPGRLGGVDLQAAPVLRGAPGGDNDQWMRERLEAGGVWMRRPPPGHQAGRFDRYWVPNESLLAEWVRQGLTNIEIPLPGGSGRISCVISLLQFGGGCGVTDPNMQEQPAQARPAPQIPFKPALQQDTGSH